MSRSIHIAPGLALALAALRVLLPAPALACSVCGCDPAAATLGLERPGTSALRLGLESRYVTKDFGQDVSAFSLQEERLQLRAQYSPLKTLSLQLELPVLWFNELNGAGTFVDSAWGPGDLQLGARVELLRAGGAIPRHVLSLVGSAKAPTGVNDHRSEASGHSHGLASSGPRAFDGAVFDEHIQPGSGSTDGLLATIALDRAGQKDAALPEERWRQLLLELTGGQREPWCLIVEDPVRPAFLQPPVPEGTLERFEAVHTPTELDVLVTAKNHDVKRARLGRAEPEHWAFALISLQTMGDTPVPGAMASRA